MPVDPPAPAPTGRSARYRARHLLAVAVVSAVVATVLAVPVAVLAAGRFSDVAESNPFFDDIEWMADTGVSEGYLDGTYRPGEPVSRQAMSAFMRRLYDLRDPVDTWSSDFGFGFSADDWRTPLSAPSAQVVVPEGTEAVLVATYNSQGRCTSAVCYGRTVLDGPGFDGVEIKQAQHCRDCYFEPFTLIGGPDEPVGPGTYTVTFQGLRSDYGTSGHDWSLSAVHLVLEAHLLPSGAG